MKKILRFVWERLPETILAILFAPIWIPVFLWLIVPALRDMQRRMFP